VIARVCTALLLMLALAGCGDAVSSGHNAMLDGADLNRMTDQMAAEIAADPDVQAAIAQKGTLKVVVQPVINQMTGEVLPHGAAQTFTGRVRLLLSQHNNNQFTWIINRDYFNYLRGTELDAVRGPDPDRVQADYALTATFSSLTHVSSERRSSYYLCAYELSNLKDGTVLWTGKYEVKKAVSKGYLD
jgi:PBP1b-binding outer membrane lipoprotein LpoB